MPVDAVGGDVHHAVLDPFDGNISRRERPVVDLVRSLHPVEPLGLLGPEPARVRDRAGIHVGIFGLIGPGALGPIGGHVINLLGHFTPSTLASARAWSGKMGTGFPQDHAQTLATPVFVIGAIMRRARLGRQAEQIRPSEHRHVARDQSPTPWRGSPGGAVAGAPICPRAIGAKSTLFNETQVKKVSNNRKYPLCEDSDSRCGARPPKWRPRAPGTKSPRTAFPGRHHGARAYDDGSAEFDGRRTRLRRSCCRPCEGTRT